MTVRTTKQLRLRRGNTAEHSNFVGAPGEITVDTDLNTIRVHNGSTQGGTVVATKNYVDSAIAAIPNTIGPAGPRGDRGEQGPAGRDGVDGVNGTNASTGNIEFRNDSMNDINGINITNASQVVAPTAQINLPANGAAAVQILNNDNSWSFDRSGTLTTPLLLPVTFTTVLDPAHYVGEGSLTLEGDAWEYGIQFQVNPNGTVQTMIDNVPHLVNPGYVTGHTFQFTESDHGIPGYTFELTLTEVTFVMVHWTANMAVSQPPDYPSTVASAGAIKLTADTKSFVFGTDGTLTLPVDGDIVDRVGNSVLVDLGNLEIDQSTILTTPDNSIVIQTSERTRVTAPCYLADGDQFVAWTEETDDIIVVQPGWTVEIGEVVYTVASVDDSVGFMYKITATGATFVQGTEYTFQSADATDRQWEFKKDGVLTLPAGGNIVASNAIGLSVGADVEILYNIYYAQEMLFQVTETEWESSIAPAVSPWAGLNSYDAYPMIMQYMPWSGGGLPPPSNIAPIAKTAKDAYELWQEALTNTNVSIGVAGNNWEFGADGKLTVPGTIFRDGALYLNSHGSTTAASVFVNGNAGSVILRTDNQQTNHDMVFNSDGDLHLPGALHVTTGLDGAIIGTNGVIVKAKNANPLSLEWSLNEEENIYADNPALNTVTASLGFGLNGVNIEVNNPTSGGSWTFGPNGTLTTPAGLSIAKQLNGDAVHIGADIQSDLNKSVNVRTLGNASSTFGWQNFEGDLNFVTLNYNQSKNILITTGNAVGEGISHNWVFNSNGNLQLPQGGTIVDYQGNSVLGNNIDLDVYKIQSGIIGTKDNPDTGNWGGYNITLDPGGESWAGMFIPSVAAQEAGSELQIYSNHQNGGKIRLSTTGGALVSSNRGTLAIGTDMETPGVPQHFHIGFENSNMYAPSNDLFLGDDFNAVQIHGTDGAPYYGVRVRANDRNGGVQQQWQFDTDGVIRLPNGGALGPVGMGWPGLSSNPGGLVSVIATDNDSNPTADLTLSTSGITATVGSNQWALTSNGLTFPDTTTQTTAWTGSVSYDNITDKPEQSGIFPLQPGINQSLMFTLTPGASYNFWLRATVDNGVIAYNATFTITNTNLPVVGQQFAYVYSGGGTKLDFVSLPDQIVGTPGTILRDPNIRAGNSSDFQFVLSNSSGQVVDLHWGWNRI